MIAGETAAYCLTGMKYLIAYRSSRCLCHVPVSSQRAPGHCLMMFYSALHKPCGWWVHCCSPAAAAKMQVPRLHPTSGHPQPVVLALGGRHLPVSAPGNGVHSTWPSHSLHASTFRTRYTAWHLHSSLSFFCLSQIHDRHHHPQRPNSALYCDANLSGCRFEARHDKIEIAGSTKNKKKSKYPQKQAFTLWSCTLIISGPGGQ